MSKINEILATRARATFDYRINFDKIGYETLPTMKEWCEENCTGLWRSQTLHALYFQFENERDAKMFMLRSATADGNQIK